MTLSDLLPRFGCLLLLVQNVALQVVFAIELCMLLAYWLHFLFGTLFYLIVQVKEALPPDKVSLQVVTLFVMDFVNSFVN